MGEIDLDALERLAEAATPGPWHCHKKDEERGEFLMDFGGMFDADGNHTGRPAMSGWISLRDSDAPYIAAANPDTVRALIDHIRALEAERDALRAACFDAVLALAHASTRYPEYNAAYDSVSAAIAAKEPK